MIIAGQNPVGTSSSPTLPFQDRLQFLDQGKRPLVLWGMCIPLCFPSREAVFTPLLYPGPGNFQSGGHFSGQPELQYNVPMKVISLQSGSNGNCIYVEAGGVRLLVDAGISASEVQERLALHGRDASAVEAVLQRGRCIARWPGLY
jgi:hypothetical protein